jgi:sulfur-carrier protein adenylyltransferase/sulfurtransferase
MLVMDLLTMSSSHVRAKRANDCPDHATRRNTNAGARASSPSESVELEFDTLDDALDAGFEVVDIREPKEIAEAPTPSSIRAVPMAELLHGKSYTPSGKALLVCASGRRSLAASQELRARGLTDVFSLKGGVQALVRSARA